MSKISNQQGYDQWSSFYDDYTNPTVAMDERFFPSYWGHHRQEKILEIGCGTGRHTQKLASRQNTVTALDVSSGMLEVARRKIQCAHVTFIEGDFLSLNISDHDYDVVIESLVLEHIEDLQGFFKKAALGLKPGGHFYLSEIHPERTQAGVMAHFKDPQSGDDIHLVSYAHTEETILRAAELADLRLLKAEDILGDQELAAANPKWLRHLGKPMIKIFHFVK